MGEVVARVDRAATRQRGRPWVPDESGWAGRKPTPRRRDAMNGTAELDKVQAQRALGRGNVVRVSVPAEVYFSLDKIQRVQKDIFGRLGHATCYSGWDIRLDLERNFLVDERLNVKPVAAVEAIG
jgi:hypothetical protein